MFVPNVAMKRPAKMEVAKMYWFEVGEVLQTHTAISTVKKLRTMQTRVKVALKTTLYLTISILELATKSLF